MQHHAAVLLYRCIAGEAVPKPAPAAGNLFRFQAMLGSDMLAHGWQQ